MKGGGFPTKGRFATTDRLIFVWAGRSQLPVYPAGHMFYSRGDNTLLETSMKKICTIGIWAALLIASAAHAQVTLNSVRIGAKDTVALAKFYQAAFGMQEVNRIDAQGGPEIFVNFGSSTDAAKANKSEPIVIMHRDSDDLKDPIAHVILNVKDMAVTDRKSTRLNSSHRCISYAVFCLKKKKKIQDKQKPNT